MENDMIVLHNLFDPVKFGMRPDESVDAEFVVEDFGLVRTAYKGSYLEGLTAGVVKKTSEDRASNVA